MAIETFIETGTFKGEMVDAQKEHFRCIITIELDRALFESARQRFENIHHIHVLNGDSGDMLPEALKLACGQTLFWLDAHYSGGVTARNAETPIWNELKIIAERGLHGDLILIDDARLFGWRSGYPSLSQIRKFVTKNWPDYELKVQADMICIMPKRILKG